VVIFKPWLTYPTGKCCPSTHWVRGWVGPRASMSTLKRISYTSDGNQRWVFSQESLSLVTTPIEVNTRKLSIFIIYCKMISFMTNLMRDIIHDNLNACFNKTTINTSKTNSLKYHFYFLCSELVTFTKGLLNNPVRSSYNTKLNGRMTSEKWIKRERCKGSTTSMCQAIPIWELTANLP
jgi:hypothetical protein